jgi:hypothetical protein
VKLKDQVSVVTGAGSGFGEGIAKHFAEQGARIIAADIRGDSAERVAREIVTAGGTAVAAQVDVTRDADVARMVALATGRFGKLDILVNNAAYQMTHASLEEISEEEWDHTFRTNIYSMFYLSKAAVSQMKPGSAIVNTASINSKSPSPQLLAYATTKGAIANFTAGLAQLLAEKGIRVNCVAPGPIWTPLIPSTMAPDKVEHFGENTPLKRPGQPAELAPAYVLLASDDGSYMSGAMIPVTGGRPML